MFASHGNRMRYSSRTPLHLFPEFSRTGESLKRKFNSIAKRSGPSGDPNCPPYVRKAKAVKKKIIEKTDQYGVQNVRNKRTLIAVRDH